MPAMIVVYYDLETTGLNRFEDEITVMSLIVHDTTTGAIREKLTHNFIIHRESGLEDDLRRRVYDLFEECDHQVGYNALGFDLLWITHWLSPCLGPLFAKRWTHKTIDFYKTAHDLLHVKIGMAKMLTDNGIEMKKSGTGLLAIEWARDRNFRDLEEYCMQDVLVLFELTQLACREYVKAKGYHRKDPTLAPCMYFMLNSNMQIVVLQNNEENVLAVGSGMSTSAAHVRDYAKRAKWEQHCALPVVLETAPVCGEYPSNIEAMLQGNAPVTSRNQAHARE